MDEEYFHVTLIHGGPSEKLGHKGETYHHNLYSKVVTLFADAPDRGDGDHHLQFSRLSNGLAEFNRITVDEPGFVLLPARAVFESLWKSDLSVRRDFGEWPQPPCELARLVVRSTVFLI